MSELVLLTPRGSGGVAVLAVRGAALERARALFRGTWPGPGEVRLGRLAAEGEDLDEALACAVGEGSAELHVHASPALVDELVRRLAPELSRPVDRAPTAARAALEELALEDLAHAPGEAAARILLDQAEGALARELAALELAAPVDLESRLARLLERGRVADFLLRPRRVVLAGAVNAGKSTLFNALVGEERVLVSPEAGTTRDVIRARAWLGAYPVDLLDTAGERALGAADRVEALGRSHGRRARAAADLVLWLRPAREEPAGAPPAGGGGGAAFALATFADHLALPPESWGPRRLSAATRPGDAASKVGAAFREHFGLPATPWCAGAAVPFRPAQLLALARALETLRAGGRPDLGALARVDVPAPGA